MASKRPKKQLESSNILELGYRAVCGGSGGGRAPEHSMQTCFLRACSLADYWLATPASEGLARRPECYGS